MDRLVLPGLAFAAGLSLVACSEPQQESTLQGPSTLANVVTEPCTPGVFNSLINGYFDQTVSPTRNQVKAQKDAMLAELNENPADSVQARVHGFNILAAIALRSKVPSPPAVLTGSTLAVEVLQCTFDVTDHDVIEMEPAASFFNEELSRAEGGTFEVRGGADDPTTPVQAAVNNAVIAGIAPPKDTAWTASLNNNRVLFYGDPATSSASDYNFAEVPGNLTYDPALVVTTCVFSADETVMVTESGIGALAFVDPSHIGCGGPLAAGSAARFGLLRHLADLGRDLLLPEPATATVAFAASLVGGSKRGQSKFDVKPVTDIALSVLQQPAPNPVKKDQFFTVKFQAKEPGSNGLAVNGTLITVVAVNNNGTPTALFLDPAGSEPPFRCGEPGIAKCTVETTTVNGISGVAEFLLSSTKSGALKILASGDVVLRQGESVRGTTTNKLNVKP